MVVCARFEGVLLERLHSGGGDELAVEMGFGSGDGSGFAGVGTGGCHPSDKVCHADVRRGFIKGLGEERDDGCAERSWDFVVGGGIA